MVVTFLASLVQSCCGEGGTLQTNITGMCGECSAMFQVHWICLHSRRVCFHGLHFSGSRLLCQELSEASPGLRALPRSKLLRFRFLGTPQRCRLGWACVLCLSRLRAAQVTRCLASGVCRITSPIPATRFSGCTMDAPSQVCPVSLLGS